MARKSKEVQQSVPGEAARLVRSVTRSAATPELINAVQPKTLLNAAGKQLATYGGSAEVSGIAQLGTVGEAAIHAWYQARTSPWVTTPAGQAIMNTVANAIARLPAVMRNTKTGKTKELPDYYDYPLTMTNPTFGRSDLWGMTVRNLYRFGTSHTLVTFGGKSDAPTRVRPMDSTRLRTRGTFVQPYWQIWQGRQGWWGGYTEYDLEAEGLPKGNIYPDGRNLPKNAAEGEANFGMLLITLNRTPESNNGVPPGMLNYDGTLAATSAQAHAADFYRDGTWQHMLVTPHHAITDVQQAQLQSKQIAESLTANHRATISNIPYDAKPLGFSAKDSQLTEVQEANLAFTAIAHNMPASLFSLRGSSYAQIYGDTTRLLVDGILPIVIEIEDEFSRLLPPNWRLHFDRNAMREADPMTAVKMEIDMFKAGLAEMDEAREGTGREPLETPWSAEAYMDGNRKPVSKLAEMTDAAIKKQQQPPPQEQPMPTGRPEEPDGEPEVEYPEVQKPE